MVEKRKRFHDIGGSISTKTALFSHCGKVEKSFFFRWFAVFDFCHCGQMNFLTIFRAFLLWKCLNLLGEFMTEGITEINRLWEAILREIEKEINDQQIYDNFFGDTKMLRLEGNKLIVAASTDLGATIINLKYNSMVERVIHSVTGTDFEVEFVSASKIQAEKPEEKPARRAFFTDSRIDPKYTFQNFVVGASNREAYQASLMISSTPGRLYNPLLLYSDSGLGKTHLLQAIGNAIKERSPATKVLFIAASDFVNEYIKFATGYKEDDQTLAEFFKENVDVLLIDDIQYIAKKTRTMEMFFVVFQGLVDRGKQVILTSDQHPSKIEGIDERLRSRFSQGLVLSIDRPDLATSEKILCSKIVAAGRNISDFEPEVITFLAERFSNNVRDLEGALNRLFFYTINVKPSHKVGMETAAAAIRSLASIQEDKTKLTEKSIIAAVADYYSLTPSQITGKIRTSRIAMARHIAMYLDRVLLDTPFIKIGETFGGKDHATVINGVRKVESSLKSDPDMAIAISEIKAKLS